MSSRAARGAFERRARERTVLLYRARYPACGPFWATRCRRPPRGPPRPAPPASLRRQTASKDEWGCLEPGAGMAERALTLWIEQDRLSLAGTKEDLQYRGDRIFLRNEPAQQR